MRFTMAALLLVACTGDTDTDKMDTDTDTGATDADTDADADSDSDTDSDTDSDADTDVPEETDTVIASFDEKVPPTLAGFGEEQGAVVVDPTDKTNLVAELVKPDNAQSWAGTTVSTCPNGTVVALPFSATNTSMSVDVWSPDAATPVLLKVENSADGGQFAEIEVSTVNAATWETLFFDFGTQIDTNLVYDRVSVFPNFDVAGADAGAKTYYVDNITFLDEVYDTSCPVVKTGDSLITFDDASITYILTGFGGAEDAVVEADPDDAANDVARVIKSATAELWAGTTFSTIAKPIVGGGSIPTLAITATDTQMTLRVRSPRAGIPVRLKIEDANDPTHSVETETSTTGVDTWETLTFDFANEATGTAALNATYTFDRVSVFFDFGTTGMNGGDGTFYFDDLAMVP